MKRVRFILFLLLFFVIIVIFLLNSRHFPFAHKNKENSPSFEVIVNTQLKPKSKPLPAFEDSLPRPLATLVGKLGIQVDFVENELIIEPANQSELAALLTQWHGKVLAIDRPKTVGIDANPNYLVRIETAKADLSALTDNLTALNPNGASSIAVNSEAARRLIAIGAAIAKSGKVVGINFLSVTNSYQDGKLTESTSGSGIMYDNAGMAVEKWDPNPFNWIYMKQGGNFDIGVTAAWQLLDRSGFLNRRKKIAIIDGGFGGADDFPPGYVLNKASFAAVDPTGPNENDCGGSPCPWHGWNAVNAAVGQVNNGIGAAGPAGPVANLIAIRRTDDIFNNIQSVTLALLSGANIISMSWTIPVPALLSWSVIPFSLATGRAHAAGKLLFAAAGNNSTSIDEKDCFLGICWESTWWVPAENDGVIAVGAMDAGSPNRRSSSNFGDEELDIWGPGSVWVAGDFAVNGPHVFTATSAATPYVAGIAALIWAANPRMSNNQVENILYETAHHGKDGQVSRWPDAYAAVVKAFGGTPPDITISGQPEEAFGSCQTKYVLKAQITDPEGGPHTVTWTSDISGILGTGETLTMPLPDGTHHITATALDDIGLSGRSNEIVLAGNSSFVAPRPTLQIISLSNQQQFTTRQTIIFEAAGLDPNKGLGGLVDGKVRWVSSRDGELGSGRRIFHSLSPGSHYIYAYYTGICGGTADDFRLIHVNASAVDGPPNMVITTPGSNDLIIYSDETGQACLQVAGFGFDEEDQDFATVDWWETDRSDLQWKVLSFNQNTTVCLKIDKSGNPTKHVIRLRGKDKKGHSAYSAAPLIVTVFPLLR